MRTGKVFKITHPLGEIKFIPSSSYQDLDTRKIKRLLKGALDELKKRDEKNWVTGSELHEKMRQKHGDYYNTAGYLLGVYRHREEYTQDELAEALGLKQHHISEMEHNKRPIGKAMAKRLADVLQCDYKEFL